MSEYSLQDYMATRALNGGPGNEVIFGDSIAIRGASITAAGVITNAPAINSRASFYFCCRRIVGGGEWVLAGANNASRIEWNLNDSSNLSGGFRFQNYVSFGRLVDSLGMSTPMSLGPGFMIGPAAQLTLDMRAIAAWVAGGIVCQVSFVLEGEYIRAQEFDKAVQASLAR